jgi:hypothetical protein
MHLPAESFTAPGEEIERFFAAASAIWCLPQGRVGPDPDVPAGKSVGRTLTLNWNGTAWKAVASPNTGSTDTLGAVATKPGAAIVWAVGQSGPPGSFNPLVLRNG